VIVSIDLSSIEWLTFPAGREKPVTCALLICKKAVKTESAAEAVRYSGPVADQGPIRIAILDSDSGFVRVLVKRAEDRSWQYRRLESVPRMEEFVAMRVNALVVDLALLEQGAWDFLERLSAAIPGLGVVVCTGRSTVAQRVRGLRLGADDWVTKPAHPEEVLARVEAVVRRRKRASARVETGPMAAGELEIRADQFQAFAAGRSVDLTRREFEVLQLLAEAEGKVLQREEIYQAVWGYAMAHGDRSVDVFVRKVRQKLEKASPDWEYIHTHFGVGYRFDAEPRGGPGVPDAAPTPREAGEPGLPARAAESPAGDDPAGLFTRLLAG
jgi:DNA-binding response OmpR family regulator